MQYFKWIGTEELWRKWWCLKLRWEFGNTFMRICMTLCDVGKMEAGKSVNHMEGRCQAGKGREGQAEPQRTRARALQWMPRRRTCRRGWCKVGWWVGRVVGLPFHLYQPVPVPPSPSLSCVLGCHVTMPPWPPRHHDVVLSFTWSTFLMFENQTSCVGDRWWFLVVEIPWTK